MTGRDLSTAEGLTAYRSLTDPPLTAPGLSVSLHLDVERGHEIDGHEITSVIWGRSTYSGDYDFAPTVSLHYCGGGMVANPDPLPSWVPVPPMVWLALTDELAGEVLP